jgi:signal transduction histidine kinase
MGPPDDPTGRDAAWPAALKALDAQAWAQQVREPMRAAELGRELAAAAPAGSPAAGHGHFHAGWAELRWGDLAAARDALAALQANARAWPDDVALQAACRDLQAGLLRREQRFDESLARLAPNLTLPEAARPPQAHCASATGAAIACGALHRMDDALRHFHRALAFAEASGDAALVANAAGNVGAAHYDVYNLDDAQHWCQRSYKEAGRAGATGARITAAVNLILVLCERQQHAQARPLVDEVLAASAGVRADKRGKYATIFADVARACGEFGRAQALLDEAAALRPSGAVPTLEWAGVQAELRLACGDAARARALAEQGLAGYQPANVDDLPLTVMRLRDCAARACETLGDWRAALRHQRGLMDYRELLLGRSARARRVALEVEHELDRARMQRDAATAEQQRLAEVNAALAAANRSKSDFLAAASHDLRQPVHALALQVAALRGELSTPRQHGMADRIERCVDALSGLFNGLLDLSRLDAGVVQPQWQAVALPALLAGLVEQHQPEAHRKGLALALRVPRGDAPPCAHSDAMLLERLLRNLIVNALRYTDAGGVLVALRRRGGGWSVQVRDSGRGIAPQLQSRVFDEFFQVGNPARRRDEGLGLGLAIVSRLARVLQHEISLRSAPGRGTCVELRLPMAAAPEPVRRAEAPAAAPLALRVAVIDDDRDTLGALGDLLAQWGCDVRTAEAAASLPGIDAWRPDAAIVDYRLPGGRDGLAEVQALRRRHGPALPCLIVTGETSPPLLQGLQESGLPWSAKPLSAQALRVWLQAQARTPD